MWGKKENIVLFPIRLLHRLPVGQESRMSSSTLASAKTPNEKEALGRQIAATDAQIDQLVYELYGLTDDEIKIVEEATTR